MRLNDIRPLNEANIVNPRDIDDWVENRISRVRRHYPETRKNLFSWLAKRVRQYVVGLTDEQAARMMQTVPSPGQSLETLASQYGDWIGAAHQRGETLFHFDWTLTSLMTPLQNAVIHVLDYIISLDAVATQPQEHEASLQAEAARQLSKITRLTLEHAVTHADKWFADLQTAGREHAEKAEATGTKVVMEFHDDFRWVEITDPAALDREGDLMQHCVGGGSYDEHLATGGVRIFSLRDKRNQPHVTVEASCNIDDEEPDDDDWHMEAVDFPWRIIQIKGKQNEGPSLKYARYIGPLLNGLKFNLDDSARYDIRNSGLFLATSPKAPQQWGTVSQVGHLIGETGPYRLFLTHRNTRIIVARGDQPMVRFDPARASTITPGGRIEHAGNEGNDTIPVADLPAVVQVLLDQGYQFTDQAEHFLLISLVVIQDGRAVRVSDLPAIAEGGGYRAVSATPNKSQILLWIIAPDGLAAYFTLTRTRQIRQVFNLNLLETPTGPLARVAADAFNALKVNGKIDRYVSGQLGKLIYRSASQQWTPVTDLPETNHET